MKRNKQLRNKREVRSEKGRKLTNNALLSHILNRSTPKVNLVRKVQHRPRPRRPDRDDELLSLGPAYEVAPVLPALLRTESDGEHDLHARAYRRLLELLSLGRASGGDLKVRGIGLEELEAAVAVVVVPEEDVAGHDSERLVLVDDELGGEGLEEGNIDVDGGGGGGGGVGQVEELDDSGNGGGRGGRSGS